MPLNDCRSVCLPYCIKKLPDGKYVVLNREYKPLGFKTQEQIEYEAYPIGVTIKITTQTAAKLSWKGSTDTHLIFLYDDGCIPTDSPHNMQQYLERLAHFAKLKVA